MSEKYKKGEKENHSKIFKKKSKIHLSQPFNSSTINHGKYKDSMEDTKESFSTQNIFRKSLSGKKQAKEAKIHKNISVSHFQHLKILQGNNRYFTEFSEGKPAKSKQKNSKTSLTNKKQQQRSTFQHQKNKNNRLSLSSKEYRNTSNTKKHKQNPSDESDQSSFLNLNKARKQLQSSIKKKCSRNTISRKQFIRITDKYQRLLDRVILSQSKPEQNTDFIMSCVKTEQKENEVLTFRVEDKKKVVCPGIKLHCIKGMKINDYHDEFMSHYEELSESWKRNLAEEKRY